MTSWLTLSGDVRQKLIFKEKKQYFCSHFHLTVDQNIFFSQQDANHVAGDRARLLMSHMETRASSLIFFFSYLYIIISKESFLYMKTQTYIK